MHMLTSQRETLNQSLWARPSSSAACTCLFLNVIWHFKFWLSLRHCHRIGNADIKDKNDLVNARKAVEREMERFKDCEKETKTKAFSKEGLMRDAKQDPKDKHRTENARMDQHSRRGIYMSG